MQERVLLVFTSMLALSTGCAEPMRCAETYTLAPSGMTLVEDAGSPLDGSLFVATLRGKHLRRYLLDGEGDPQSEIFYVSAGRDYGGGPAPGDRRFTLDQRLRDVEYHAGSLYVIGDRQGIAKITPRTR